jgi:phosphohistidine phosphatase
MLRLILLRHATAERAASGQSDHERALTKGGRKESVAAGRAFAERGEKIDLVLSSDAKRTRETWDGVTEELEMRPEVRFLPSLFEAGDYLPIVRAEAGEAKCVLLIGHNPAMHATAMRLAASLAGRDGTKLRSGFPKGAFAVLDFDGEWDALQPGRMRLMAFIEPEAG